MANAVRSGPSRRRKKPTTKGQYHYLSAWRNRLCVRPARTTDGRLSAYQHPHRPRIRAAKISTWERPVLQRLLPTTRPSFTMTRCWAVWYEVLTTRTRSPGGAHPSLLEHSIELGHLMSRTPRDCIIRRWQLGFGTGLAFTSIRRSGTFAGANGCPGLQVFFPAEPKRTHQGTLGHPYSCVYARMAQRYGSCLMGQASIQRQYIEHRGPIQLTLAALMRFTREPTRAA